MREHELNLRNRALKVIPSGTSTRGRGFIEGVPTHIVEASGCMLKLTDGRNYLDMRGALGSTLLGYGYLEKESPRLRRAFLDSPLHSLACVEEVELAELLLERIYTKLDQVRFFKTGADACSAAIKLARAATGKLGIISCGYHGWHDQWSTGAMSKKKGAVPSLGTPSILSSYIIEIDYGDVSALRDAAKEMHDLAAIITVPLDWDLEPNQEFIQECRRLSHDRHAALIFDEIFCGFRLNIKGGSGFYGVDPDLVCISKSMASGYPISALIGKYEYMNFASMVLMSSTFSTDRLSIVAAIETINLLLDEEKNILNTLRKRGSKFAQNLKQLLIEENINDIEVFGQPLVPRFLPISKDIELSHAFAREMAKEGILCNGIFLLNFSHSEKHLELLISKVCSVLKKMGTDMRGEKNK